MHYVYKVTNNINGKFYIGKRKHDDPVKDSYMGSGKLILAAIDKYGKNNFTKEIIEIFQTNEEAAKLEKKLVTKEIIESSMCYNMHEGGHGGFGHINNLPPEERINVIAYKEKVQNGEISVGGTKNWSEESYRKVREFGWDGLRRKGILQGNSPWENYSEDKKKKVTDKISIGVSGNKNGAFGTHIYAESSLEKLPDMSILNKNRFKEGEQPFGWITIKEWRDSKKNKKSGTYGKKWYNNSNKNYFLCPTDDKILKLNLKLGRLKINNCCGFFKDKESAII